MDEADFPDVETNRALLLIDLQDDFLSDKGELKVANADRIVRNIAEVVPQFRDIGDVIWVKTERKKRGAIIQDADGILLTLDHEPKDASALRARTKEMSPAGRRTLRTKKTQDMLAALMSKYEMPPLSPGEQTEVKELAIPKKVKNEEFLGRMALDRGPSCCVAGTAGALFAEAIEPLIDRESDMVTTKHTYSALRETSLLPALRGGLITELYVAGAITNIQVYATVCEAIQYGFSIILLEDCLGYNYQDRHDEAIKQMCEDMGAEMISSSELVSDLTHHDEPVPLLSDDSLLLEVDKKFLESDGRKPARPSRPPQVPNSQPNDSIVEVYQMLQNISLKDPTWAKRNLAETMKASKTTVQKIPEKVPRSAKAKTQKRRESPVTLAPGSPKLQQSIIQAKANKSPLSPTTIPSPGVQQKQQKKLRTNTKDQPASPTISRIAEPPIIDATSPDQGKTLARKGARRSLRT